MGQLKSNVWHQMMKDMDYKLHDATYGRGVDIRIHIGRPMDFRDQIRALKNEGFTFEDIAAADTYCDEKRNLYRRIRDQVRARVILGQDACRAAGASE